MEVGSRSKYPGNKLGNFAGNRFVLDGVICAGMEGFLQSLKFKEPMVQVQVCLLSWMAAKKRGKGKNWHREQVLWWQGFAYPRKSDEYQELLTRAYDAMLEQSGGFKKAFMTAGPQAKFTHSIGKSKKNQTILTEAEFCAQLHRCRDQVFEELRNG